MFRNILDSVFQRRELERLLAQRESFLKGNAVPLSQLEKKMIFDALCIPAYKEKVEMPATKWFIRNVYRLLKAKIAASIKEMG